MKPSDYGIVQSHPYVFPEFDFYKYPEDIDEWKECPFCGCKPKVWRFDNGRSTACGCLLQEYNQYNHFAIFAESVMSVYTRTGFTKEYEIDGLKNNWNVFCETGKIVFDRANVKERW